MTEPQPATMPLVGVGASAGGLTPLLELLSALPLDSGMAFFVVQHLDPDLPSALVQVLSRASSLPVVPAADGARIRPNVVHVAQPGTQLTVDGATVRLHTNGKTHSRPVDAFLRSLAASAGQRSIGILLSGSGTDGRAGLTAVREAGGFTLVQDGSAQFTGMPQAAIDAGVVDLVMPPTKIAAELASLVDHPYVRTGASTITSSDDDARDRAAFGAILGALRSRRGVEFAEYKEPTLQRRVLRRMVVRKTASLTAYAQLLAAEPSEVDALFEDVLIKVTEFFRDPETFEVLQSRLRQRLAATPDRTEPLRIWVVGCATGEEAYSLAIVASEACDGLAQPPLIQIFGTDISETAIAVARAGVYTAAQCAHVSEARRDRFFSPSGGDLQLRKDIRELCVFARHDVAHDPPFSRMDTISCRNVLIYFGNELQHRIIPTLHYALRPGGLLVVGPSESIGRNEDLFESDGDTRTIHTRRIGSRVRLAESPPLTDRAQTSVPAGSAFVPRTRGLEQQADRVALARHAPPGVIIDARGQVLQFRGDTSPFLRNAPGRASLDLDRLAHADLRRPLAELLAQARELAGEAVRETAWSGDRERGLAVTLRVVPLERQTAEGYLVTFEAPTSAPRRDGLPTLLRRYGRRLFDRLDAVPETRSRAAPNDTVMLASTRAELRGLAEDHQTTTEELNTANEQVVSSNEELQSSNEELQIAKEEVLASNEELTTVNEELEGRNRLLSRAHDDLANLLASTDIPIVVVGKDRRIRWFTPNAGPMLNLIPGDIGRLIDHIKPTLEVPALETTVAAVIRDQRPRGHTVQAPGGSWLRVAVTPYRTAEAEVDGAVIAIVDVDELKRAQAELLRQRTYPEWIVDTVRVPLLIVDETLRVVAANRAYDEAFGTPAGSMLGQRLHEADRRWDRDELRTWIADCFVVRPPRSARVLELSSTTGGGTRRFRFEANRILRGERSTLLLVEIEDVTALREHEQREADLVNEVLRAQSQERESLARELHDETGQVLSALLVGLRALSERVPDADTRAFADELRERVRELIDAVRRLARGLHPTAVEELGLVNAVRALAEGFGKVHAISMQLDIEPDEVLDGLTPAVRLAIYRVIQEGLTNIARHARAGTVVLQLRHDAGAVDVQISDDGCGFDVQTESPGLGLRLMKRRVVQLGGEFTLGVRSGGGTVVDVQVPVGAGDA